MKAYVKSSSFLIATLLCLNMSSLIQTAVCTESDEEQPGDVYQYTKRGEKSTSKSLTDEQPKKNQNMRKYWESLRRRLPFRPVLSPFLDNSILPQRVKGKRFLAGQQLHKYDTNQRQASAKWGFGKR